MTASLLLILGMTAVTLLPRLAPALLPPGFALPPVLRRWLEQVPCAALGALIFPGILDADGPWTGAAAAAAAVAAALLRLPAFAAALAAVLAAVAVKLV